MRTKRFVPASHFSSFWIPTATDEVDSDIADVIRIWQMPLNHLSAPGRVHSAAPGGPHVRLTRREAAGTLRLVQKTGK